MPYYHRIEDTELELPGGVTISGLYLVASLEIAVRDEHGVALTLRLHSYPADSRQEGSWAPPNLQYHVNSSYEAPQRPSDIFRCFDRFIADRSKGLLKDITLFAESFGLRGAVVHQLDGDPLVELKPSINQPQVINAFRTVRFALTELQERSEANLVDREGRHGFVLLPVPLPRAHASVQPESHELVADTSSALYLGKPIISGLLQVLKHPTNVQAIRQRAIDVTQVSTRRSERGLIAAADIAGYGRVLAVEYMGLVGRPETERRSYQARVLRALETALTATGTTQVQTAGDGFLAGYPTGDNLALAASTFAAVVRHWTATVRLLHADINIVLAEANNPNRLGSRIAMNFGDYEWGRINGLDSFTPAFNGMAVVDTARMEQGLNEYSADRVKNGRMDGSEHLMAISADLAALLVDQRDPVLTMEWRFLEECSLEAKQKVMENVQVFQWVPTRLAN